MRLIGRFYDSDGRCHIYVFWLQTQVSYYITSSGQKARVATRTDVWSTSDRHMTEDVLNRATLIIVILREETLELKNHVQKNEITSQAFFPLCCRVLLGICMARAAPTNRRAVLLAAFIAFGGFLFGYDIGVISGCLIMPDFVDRFGQMGTDGKMFLSSARQSIITSLLSAGTFVGAVGQAFTSDRFGRRSSILLWTAIFMIGVAIQIATQRSIVQISTGRLVAGLGVGALSAIVPLYNGETAPKALRGALLVLYQTQIFIGLFLSFVFDLATHHLHTAASWRIPIGFQLIWGGILFSGIFFLPESPRHLVGTGRQEEARQVVANLNGVPLDDSLVDEAVEELEYAIRVENEGGKATWMECFSTRNNLWKRTTNGMVLQFLQQLNGQNFYYYYGDTFFQSAGSSLDPYAIQAILGAVSVLGTIPALVLIEKMGRRRSLLVGALLEAVCALIGGLVGHFMSAPTGTVKSLLTSRNIQGGDVLIAFAMLHVFIFGIFWGPTPWVYLGESFPLRVRPKSIAFGCASTWSWNFLLSFFAPRIAQQIGPLILLIFCGSLLFAWVYVYLFIPETRGLSLEEVDEMYRAGIKPWNSTNWKPHLMDELRNREARKSNEKSDLDD